MFVFFSSPLKSLSSAKHMNGWRYDEFSVVDE